MAQSAQHLTARAARERAEEEAFFHSSSVPENVIRLTQFGISNNSNIILPFETPSQKYALLVIAKDVQCLGWRECQALADCMLIAARGTKLDSVHFERLVEKLDHKYGKTAGPALQDGRLVAIVYPGPGKAPGGGVYSIDRCSLRLDADGDPVIAAVTKGGLTYNVCIQLTAGGNRMQNLDCKAFVDAVVMLETGDNLPPALFLAKGAAMRKKYNFVLPEVRDRRLYSVSVLASRYGNREPMHRIFVDALRELKNDSGGFGVTPSVPLSGVNGGGVSGLACPYPGVKYTKALKESGQAQVYSGEMGNRKVAVKVFADQESETALDVYKIELRMLLKMSRHENVVEVLNFFDSPKPALLMSLIEGEDLMDYIKNHGRFEEGEGREVCKGIAKGLCHLHLNGVVHRDLKSLNILMRPDKVPVIIDLGMGSILEKKLKAGTPGELTVQEVYEKTTALKGTVLWMAPEMIMNQIWSDKTDVYAFGVIMWEVFSGKIPFQSGGRDRPLMQLLVDIAQGERPDLGQVRHVGNDLCSIMEACWHENPKMRPSMRRVLDCLTGNDPREIFKTIDNDDSGTLDFNEFVMFLDRYAPGQVPPREIYPLFEAIDVDRSGEISAQEFEKFWRQVEMSGVESAVSNVGFSSQDVSQFIEDM